MPSDCSAVVGKHALVTGGSRGIGHAIAVALAANGARVSIVSRNPAGVEGDFTVVKGDVSDEDQVKSAFAQCRKRNGPVEILINNSGISDSAPLTRTSKGLFDRIIATNLTGTFLCSREAAQDMLIEKWGRILNVASIAGLYGAPYIAAYCASKHGVIGLTRAVAAEFAGTGITVNAICPGYTETSMMQQAIAKIVHFTGASEDNARETLAGMNPEGRIATPDEVAEAALALLCGDKNGISLVIPGNIEA
ncbi:MAG TPA: SDR family oxidoreductase [Candidatus Aquilonibacter sp.]|nr:SDR family oxidoreductase [Candidatus Aquilonibacter sp.]